MKSLFTNLKGDSFGGVTAGIVALPLALAFGVQSGMGAAAGLYGAMMLGFFAALFGGTPSQVSGPTGPMTVVTATVVAGVVAKFGGLEKGLGVILLTFLLAGLFQIAFGMLKIGKYIRYIPYPVLSGFMTGIGVIIIGFQLFPMMGLESPSKLTLVFRALPEAVNSLHPLALALGGVTIAIIYVFPKITKAVPGTLIALILVSAACYFMKLDVPLIGSIPQGLPALKAGALLDLSWSDIGFAIAPALTLAGLGTIDSLLTSIVADNMTKTRHNSNKELIGQGIGNMASSLIGGIPGAGATMRTVVNVKSGGKTKLSGMVHALVLFLIVLGLGRFVAYVPLCVLAGVLITVGISIVDRKGLFDLVHIPRSDAIILVLVLLLTVFVDLLQAVGIGMVLASVLFMKKLSDTVESKAQLRTMEEEDESMPWADEKEFDFGKWGKKVYIKRLEGPIFFGVTADLFKGLNKLPADARVVILRMKRVPFIDQSGLYALEELITNLQARGVTVVMTMIQPQPRYMLKNIRMVPDIIPEENLFDSLEKCALWLKEFMRTADSF